jgi:hypothetical protein
MLVGELILEANFGGPTQKKGRAGLPKKGTWRDPGLHWKGPEAAVVAYRSPPPMGLHHWASMQSWAIVRVGG